MDDTRRALSPSSRFRLSEVMDTSPHGAKTPFLVKRRYGELLNAKAPPSPACQPLDARFDHSALTAGERAVRYHGEQPSENGTAWPEHTSLLHHEETLENRTAEQEYPHVYRHVPDTGTTAQERALLPGLDQAIENRNESQGSAVMLEEVPLHSHHEEASRNALQNDPNAGEISTAEGVSHSCGFNDDGNWIALQEAAFDVENVSTAEEGLWYPSHDHEREKGNEPAEDSNVTEPHCDSALQNNEGATRTAPASDGSLLTDLAKEASIADLLQTIGLGDWFSSGAAPPDAAKDSSPLSTSSTLHHDHASPASHPVENTGSKALDLLTEIANKGIDGVGSFVSAKVLADEYRNEKSLFSVKERINSLIWHESRKVFAVGFATGLFGLAALPVTVPAGLFLSWVTQARLSAAIAHLCGYDVMDPHVRTVVMVTLLGASGKAVLKRMGVTVAEKMASHVIKHLPTKVFIEINKAVGHQLITKAGSSGTINLIKWVPVIGGVVGGSVDCIACTTTGEVARWAFYKKVVEKLGRGPRSEDSTWEWEDYAGSD